MDPVPEPKTEQEMQVVRLVLGRDALADNPRTTLEKDMQTLEEHKKYIERCMEANTRNLEKVEERIAEYRKALESLPKAQSSLLFRVV